MTNVERASKLFVLGSTIAAVTLHATLAAREWNELPVVLGVGALLTAVAARRWTGALQGGLVGFGFVAAGAFSLAGWRFGWHSLVVWLACVLVGMLARSDLRWRIPPPWRFALIGWALVLAVSWPLAVLRELDFSLALLDDYGWLNPGVPMPPPTVALWIVHVVVVQLVGILWFDWLCGAYTSERRQRFERQILLPMGGAVLVACLVGVYQGLVDVHWLSGGPWPELGRATGTLGDANVFGMVAALWAPMFLAGGVAVVPRLGTRTAMWLGGIGLLIACGAVWMSGSRTAFLALAVGVTLIVAPACRRLASRETRPLPFVLGAVGFLVLAAFAALIFVSSTGPGERIREMLPPPSVEGAQGLARTLWDRGWYGPAAHLMIRDHPFVGVGVGAFHPLVGQYARLAGSDVPFDNAQNWYRHQLAELGLVGSVPWILWVIFFAGFLLRTHGDGEQRFPAAVAKGVLVALGVASLLGVPAQGPAVALTFWTFAFWYIQLVGGPRLHAVTMGPAASGWPAWTVVLLMVAVYAAGTFQAARGDLRVPYRSTRWEWPYAYGIENAGEVGIADDHRWTGKRSVFTLAYPRGRGRGRLRVKLSAWLEYPDAPSRHVKAKIWTYGREPVLDATGWDGSRITRYLDTADDEHLAVVVETWVERTWRSPESKLTEIENRGMTLAWEWVDPQGRPVGPRSGGS